MDRERKREDNKRKTKKPYGDRNAIRTKKRGRAKAGMIMAVGNKIEWKRIGEDHSEEESKKIIAVEVKLGNRKWIVITVYMNEHKEENFERIENIIESNPGTAAIVRGDFNARTVDEGERAGEGEKRISRDKIINKEGREITKEDKQNGSAHS